MAAILGGIRRHPLLTKVAPPAKQSTHPPSPYPGCGTPPNGDACPVTIADRCKCCDARIDECAVAIEAQLASLLGGRFGACGFLW